MVKSFIQTEITSRNVASITLNRPEAHNALNGAMFLDIVNALEDFEANPDIRLLVLRGNGKSFCAGADLKDAGTSTALSMPTVARKLQAFSRPVVTLLHGACIGGGVAFAAVADVVIAAEDTYFSIPEVRLGFNPASLIPMFNQAMGARNALRYVLGGDRFDATKAYEMGLVHHLCSAGQLEETTAPIIDALLAGGPQAIIAAKQTMLELSGQIISEELADHLAVVKKASGESDEAAEGRASFKEKRPPKWALSR